MKTAPRPATRRRRRRPLRRQNWYVQPADLRPVRRRPLWAQAADQIRQRIVLGELRPGQRLEAAPKLALELGVSMPVVREAVAALTYLKLLEVRHGIGTFVARRLSAAAALQTTVRHARRHEVAHLRARLVEAAAAGAARRKVTGRQLRHFERTLLNRERAILEGDPEWLTQADLDFHLAVAQLAGRASALAEDLRLDELHRALFEAIAAGKVQAAVRCARGIVQREHAWDDEAWLGASTSRGPPLPR